MSETDTRPYGQAHEYDIAAAVENAVHELELGRWRIARVWLNLACDLEREQRDARKTPPATDIVAVPIMRDGGVCIHGYGVYIAGGQKWHRATGSVCNPNPGLDTPPAPTYATAACSVCGTSISAHGWHQDQLEVGAYPGHHETVPGMIMWEGWTHDDHEHTYVHDAVPVAPVVLTEDGRTLTR